VVNRPRLEERVDEPEAQIPADQPIERRVHVGADIARAVTPVRTQEVQRLAVNSVMKPLTPEEGER